MPRLEFPTLPATHREDVERHILDRTGRRVHGLHVEIRHQRVILRGRTSSFYLKQLAQHCVWDLLPSVPLENGIIVE